MQTLNWYFRRLKAMSPTEITWRLYSSVRDRTDRLVVKSRQKQRPPEKFLNNNDLNIKPGFHVCNISEKYNSNQIENKELLERAERILSGQLSFFDQQNKFIGNPVKWNYDHKLGIETPLIFSSLIDYRDINETGDCKHVWEPNRHHHLVVLARAYYLSDDIRFAQAVAEQLDSWLEQNPYGLGMNWRSCLELGIRLINWVWAIDLIRESKVISEKLNIRIIDSVSRHVWEINRKYVRGSSINNHLIGEAAGVFVATSYFTNLKNASKLRNKAKEILAREIINQTYPDGGTKEQAFGYHIFVLQFFVISGTISRVIEQDFSKDYWLRLEKMFEFAAGMGESGYYFPLFGDCDDGYVLDIGDNPRDIRQWLEVGAALFDREDFCTEKKHSGLLKWLPGDIENNNKKKNEIKCTSKAFEQTGYYLLQYGKSDSNDCISVVFDCGPLGMGSLAGHGHADALSFTLRAFGKDIFVDPGTYDYFSYPDWREYFRSTQAHNTIVVDEENQSEMLGLFLWGRKAQAKCLCWEPSDKGGIVSGEHNGYSCLDDPVIHKRTLELDGMERILIIKDEIVAHKEHTISLYLHMDEHCKIMPLGANKYKIETGQKNLEISLDSAFQIELYKGSENPNLGWISRGYHQKKESTTIVGNCSCDGNSTLVSKIYIGK